jgi:hypothetical protein
MPGDFREIIFDGRTVTEKRDYPSAFPTASQPNCQWVTPLNCHFSSSLSDLEKIFGATR